VENTDIKIVSIPPPIDGIDYISPPDQMTPSSARDLLNYYAFDWGIRPTQKHALYAVFAEPIGSMHGVAAGGGITPFILVMTTTKIWRVVPSASTTTNITAALVITSGNWNFNEFNKYVFLFNGVDAPIRYEISTATASLSAFTTGGSPVPSLKQGWNYKQKIYAFQLNTTIVWYTSTFSAVTGPMLSYDVGDLLHTFGAIVFGTSWSYNQGFSNDELMVLVSENGEVLIFSGLDPASADWALIGRAVIPRPIGSKCFTRLGQDVLIGTSRGVISLKDVFAGRNEDATYFSVSRKVNPLALLNCEVALNRNLPFLYFQNNASDDYSIYVLNYERGAWTRINNSYTVSNHPVALTWLGGGDTITGSNALFLALNDGSNSLLSIADSTTDTTGVLSKWITPFFSFSSIYRKTIKLVRTIVRNINSTTSSTITLSIATQAMGEDAQAFETSAITATDTRYYSVDVAPTGLIDNAISLVFSKTGAGEVNEINGCDILYEEGGIL
jgi:hypothetical protein